MDLLKDFSLNDLSKLQEKVSTLAVKGVNGVIGEVQGP